MGINRVALLGRVGKDPELKFTQSGTAICSFSMATGERWKDKDGQYQEKTEWHNIVVWGKFGEIVAKSVKKGAQIYVEGKLTTRNWEDDSGKKNYRTEIIVNVAEFLGAKISTGENQEPTAPEQSDDLPF